MKRKEILIILISGFLLIIAWVGFSIYHSAISSTIPEATNINIRPINSTFDTKAFSALRQRKSVSPLYEISSSSSASSPTPTVSISATPKPTPTPTPTQIASPEGEILP